LPIAAFLILAGPMTLAAAPVPPVVETPAALPVAGTRRAPPALSLLPLEWSLAEVAQAEDLSQDDRGTGQAELPDENEIVVEGEYGPVAGDPAAAFNEESYRITRELDEVFLEPVAYAYRDGLPGPLRDGLGNVVRNLGEPVNFLNFLLQLKIGKAAETLGRFAINSSLGLGGLIDVAGKPGVGLPYRRNGFANTLGYYGVGPGAYLYLPFTGATSVRDVIGNGLDQFVLPVGIGEPFNTLEFTVPYFIIGSLDARLEVDAELERIDATVDPYAARRDTYLWRRARDIAQLRGEEPPPPPAILQEVEGTGEFGEEPVGGNGAVLTEPTAPRIAYQDVLEMPRSRPNLAITHIRTARRTGPGEAPRTR
jgi:phospholipid-binding lipoprotein MlaA